ncbi:MAG: hypothetical protein K0Q59_2774 [Paenibacillus sp.]|jgi:inosose dehydratase|nr:hypothetical protein [Paenibacillus sp.]
MTIHIGCQTYTWQMSYDKYAGKLSQLLDVIQKAGYAGVEAEVCMLGSYYDDPGRLAGDLDKRALKLAALTLALPWTQAEETEEERKEADRLIAYLRHFPGAKLILVQLPGGREGNLPERQRNAMRIINEVGRRASEQGLVCAHHPNSPAHSLFRTQGDYDVMFSCMDERYVGYAPDSGHIANGGMDALTLLRQTRSLIRHVHFKDISASGQWAAMGNGVIDHPAIVDMLRQTHYEGWIMVEEESEQAKADPDAAALHNGAYMRRFQAMEDESK